MTFSFCGSTNSISAIFHEVSICRPVFTSVLKTNSIRHSSVGLMEREREGERERESNKQGYIGGKTIHLQVHACKCTHTYHILLQMLIHACIHTRTNSYQL